MHVIVSWDTKIDEPRRGVIDELMRSALKPHGWVRPLSTLYIVKIASDTERILLKDRLVSAVKSVPEKVHFVMSPAMVGGKYNGWLPKDMWPKINKRIEP